MTKEKEVRLRKKLQRASYLRGAMTIKKLQMSRALEIQAQCKDDVAKEKWVKKELEAIAAYKKQKEEYDNL